MRKTLNITIDPEVAEVLKKDAKRFGLSQSAYLAQLVMQKNIEMNAMRLISSMSDDQLADEVRKQLGTKLG